MSVDVMTGYYSEVVGGSVGVNVIVDCLFRELGSDPVTARVFAIGRDSDIMSPSKCIIARTNLDKLRTLYSEFLTETLGGPSTHSNREICRMHMELDMTDKITCEVITKKLAEVLASGNIDEDIIQETVERFTDL